MLSQIRFCYYIHCNKNFKYFQTNNIKSSLTENYPLNEHSVIKRVSWMWVNYLAFNIQELNIVCQFYKIFEHHKIFKWKYCCNNKALQLLKEKKFRWSNGYRIWWAKTVFVETLTFPPSTSIIPTVYVLYMYQYHITGTYQKKSPHYLNQSVTILHINHNSVGKYIVYTTYIVTYIVGFANTPRGQFYDFVLWVVSFFPLCIVD